MTLFFGTVVLILEHVNALVYDLAGLGIAAAILSKSDIMAGASCSGICVLAFLSISMGECCVAHDHAL